MRSAERMARRDYTRDAIADEFRRTQDALTQRNGRRESYPPAVSRSGDARGARYGVAAAFAAAAPIVSSRNCTQRSLK